MNLPERLHPGDRVGIFSPSSPIEPEAVDKMVQYFQERGYTVTIAPNTLAKSGFMAGSPTQRASDLNALLHDASVRMVMTSMGGAGAVHLVPLIDYTALAADPKIVVGLSDPSILLNAITQEADIPTFHGPNGVEFGGLCPLTPFCEENFWRLVRDELQLPYAFPMGEHFQVLRGGSSETGRLVGGNFGTIEPLIGTRWEPDWQGAILFVEEFIARPSRTDQLLAHFRLAGVFDQIKALIVGQPVEVEPEAESMEEIILRNCAGYLFPIVTDILVGHTDDKLTVPIGCQVRLDPAGHCLELLESPTKGD